MVVGEERPGSGQGTGRSRSTMAPSTSTRERIMKHFSPESLPGVLIALAGLILLAAGATMVVLGLQETTDDSSLQVVGTICLVFGATFLVGGIVHKVLSRKQLRHKRKRCAMMDVRRQAMGDVGFHNPNYEHAHATRGQHMQQLEQQQNKANTRRSSGGDQQPVVSLEQVVI